MPDTFQNANRKGKIVVCNDEWPLSDMGFSHAKEDATALTLNLAQYFLEGRKKQGNFYMGTTNEYLNNKKFKDALKSGSHKVSDGADSSTMDRATMNTVLTEFDGMIVGGRNSSSKWMIPPADILTEYLLNGGCVYLAACAFSDDTLEVSTINKILNQFSVEMDSTGNTLKGESVTINGTHELFDGVSALYMNHGYDLQLLQSPSYPRSYVTVPDPKNTEKYLFSISEVPTVRGYLLDGADITEWSQYTHHFRWEDAFLSVILAYNMPPHDSSKKTWNYTSSGDRYGTGSCKLWVKNTSEIPVHLHRVQVSSALEMVPSNIVERSDLAIYYNAKANMKASDNGSKVQMDLFEDKDLAPGDVLASSKFHWGLMRDKSNDSSFNGKTVHLDLGLFATPQYTPTYSPTTSLQDLFSFTMQPLSS